MSNSRFVLDTSTACQKLQRQQWQKLDTLHRLRANLQTAIGYTVYKEEQDYMQVVCRIVDAMIARNLSAQRSLPSKKNKKLGLVRP